MNPFCRLFLDHLKVKFLDRVFGWQAPPVRPDAYFHADRESGSRRKGDLIHPHPDQAKPTLALRLYFLAQNAGHKFHLFFNQRLFRPHLIIPRPGDNATANIKAPFVLFALRAFRDLRPWMAESPFWRTVHILNRLSGGACRYFIRHSPDFNKFRFRSAYPMVKQVA